MTIADLATRWFTLSYVGAHPTVARNEYGEEIADWSDTYSGVCALRQLNEAERSISPMQVYVATHRLYTTADAEIVEGDRVSVNGREYRVVGVNDVMAMGQLLQVDLQYVSSDEEYALEGS